MSVHTGISIGLASLAVLGVSACAAEKPQATPTSTAASTTAAPAAAGTTTVTVTATSTPAATASTPMSTPTSTPTSTSGSPMVGGMTECTTSALAQPATQAAQALGADNLYTIDRLDCADGWAVTSGVLASKDNPQMGAPTSFVFEQQGQFWIPKDKAAICGTNPTTTTPPADAVIPAELFAAGCAAG